MKADGNMATILIVDDMPTFRDSLATALRSAGYQTVAAASGLEALAVIRNSRPDLILLDLAMPVMSGLACLQAIRADPALRKFPVVVLTGMNEKAYVLQARTLGIKGYLLKAAFSRAELLARVKEALASDTAAKPAAA
jgi:CheY-like chemotaxis protein